MRIEALGKDLERSKILMDEMADKNGVMQEEVRIFSKIVLSM